MLRHYMASPQWVLATREAQVQRTSSLARARLEQLAASPVVHSLQLSALGAAWNSFVFRIMLSIPRIPECRALLAAARCVEHSSVAERKGSKVWWHARARSLLACRGEGIS